MLLFQALGIKGKMFAKKRYAEKALMKKTLVNYFPFIYLFLSLHILYNVSN